MTRFFRLFRRRLSSEANFHPYRAPEPVWACWTPEIAKGLVRK